MVFVLTANSLRIDLQKTASWTEEKECIHYMNKVKKINNQILKMRACNQQNIGRWSCRINENVI